MFVFPQLGVVGSDQVQGCGWIERGIHRDLCIGMGAGLAGSAAESWSNQRVTGKGRPLLQERHMGKANVLSEREKAQLKAG